MKIKKTRKNLKEAIKELGFPTNSSTKPSQHLSNQPISNFGKREPSRCGNIPMTEEGSPRSEFGSRGDFKKDSKANFVDSRKNKLL